MLGDRTNPRSSGICQCGPVELPSSYESSLAFEDGAIEAAAVYCSDGRFGIHFDDFLRQHVELTSYDRVVVPGGPACLAERPSLRDQQLELESQLRFLVEAHGLCRIVLIAHSDCGFYQRRLGLAGDSLAAVQREDLCRAASRVRRLGPVEVSAFVATASGARVSFAPVSDR